MHAAEGTADRMSVDVAASLWDVLWASAAAELSQSVQGCENGERTFSRRDASPSDMDHAMGNLFAASCPVFEYRSVCLD